MAKSARLRSTVSQMYSVLAFRRQGCQDEMDTEAVGFVLPTAHSLREAGRPAALADLQSTEDGIHNIVFRKLRRLREKQEGLQWRGGGSSQL